MVTYTYDAWGNILETLGTMAATLGKTNALTYRGYVYDNETELYYLQSRYYNPERGRFINADSYVSTGQGIIGNNMFTYCNNNSENGRDPCGRCFHRWDFWNDCERCSGQTFQKRLEESYNQIENVVEDIFGTTRQWMTDCKEYLIDSTRKIWGKVSDAWNDFSGRLSRMDGEKIAKEAVKETAKGVFLGGAEGLILGKWGIPYTEGFSVPACGLIGAILGGSVGFLGGLWDGIIEEFFKEK